MAATVVTHEPIGCFDHVARAAVVDLERMRGCRRKQLREVDQPGRIGPAVAVDRLVVVADAEHRQTRRRQQPHQQHVRGCEVLEFVDQQHAAGTLGGGPGIGVGEQNLQCRVHLLVEVDHPVAAQCGAILRPHLDQAVDFAVVTALDGHRVDQAQTDRAQRFDPHRDRVGVAFARKLHQPPDDAPHLEFVDGAHLLASWSKRRRAVDDRQRDRVEGANLQPAQVAGARPHLFLGTLVERHQADGRGRQPPFTQQVARPLGEHAGLAAASGSDDACRATMVSDRSELIGGQIGGGRGIAGRDERAMFESDRVHDADPADRGHPAH
ncbi:MAG TPA: hypothetical protein PLV68_12800, partial [Ilumatobacteraceae bacterium]|nr:hypothetical protein [Ilumatobacteraceae bacterium]